MMTITKSVLAAAAVAFTAGAAVAGPINGTSRGPAPAERGGPTVHIEWTITHDIASTSFIKSLLITVLDPFSGDVLPFGFIAGVPAPTATVGGLARAIEMTEIIPLPDANAVRWTFADSDLWLPGETITFGFDFTFPTANTDYLIGEDYTFTTVPAPGASAFAALGIAGLLRRRR